MQADLAVLVLLGHTPAPRGSVPADSTLWKDAGKPTFAACQDALSRVTKAPARGEETQLRGGRGWRRTLGRGAGFALSRECGWRAVGWAGTCLVLRVGHEFSNDPLVDAEVLFGCVQSNFSMQFFA